MDKIVGILSHRIWRRFWLLWDFAFMIWDAVFGIRAIARRDWLEALLFGVLFVSMVIMFRFHWRIGSPKTEVIGHFLPLDPAKIEEFDFSEFHPLDHAWWACVGYPGGLRRHLQLWHDYLAPDPIGALMCLVGQHDWVEAWVWSDTNPDGRSTTTCRRCWKPEA